MYVQTHQIVYIKYVQLFYVNYISKKKTTTKNNNYDAMCVRMWETVREDFVQKALFQDKYDATWAGGEK